MVAILFKIFKISFRLEICHSGQQKNNRFEGIESRRKLISASEFSDKFSTLRTTVFRKNFSASFKLLIYIINFFYSALLYFLNLFICFTFFFIFFFCQRQISSKKDLKPPKSYIQVPSYISPRKHYLYPAT